ncbi:vesicular integral-membrane protein VIP36 precursor, putative [Entamoeba invadens IP1]|uniref:vesicular integral-membrane protein VIP36 precursor, putative n=1 Tax=Entamoeba invadens IP1 TaxID=370355 RepID=UPI0002C3FAA0|nr:vesicular integral-membrane protein VIP36 precursor, putative [Entamoeba invadens IP1]ELP85136.1 vesicular integral-membrane protein VIP36 precursor, putative [Entamoeba invadens IP1]|eukprot:XP_004184482.1 vesicular integral-membrane protein VIP36 precursor, putative [Entamoeba invadens IP1]
MILLLLVTTFGHVLDLKTPIDPEKISEFYRFEGSTQILSDRIILTPDVNDKSGRLTSLRRIKSNAFKVEIELNVYTQKRIMGDGVGIWFTNTQIFQGEAHGGPTDWKGFALFIDTYDNDRNKDTPLVLGIQNNNDKVFKDDNDGTDIANAKCTFRELSNNKDLKTKVTITYSQNTISVTLENKDAKVDCFTTENINLEEPFLSFSAKTGGVSQLSQIFGVSVTELPQNQDTRSKKYKEQNFKQTDEKIDEGLLFKNEKDEELKIKNGAEVINKKLDELKTRVEEISKTANINNEKFNNIHQTLIKMVEKAKKGEETFDVNLLITQFDNLQKFYDLVLSESKRTIDASQRLVRYIQSPTSLKQESHMLFWGIVIVVHIGVVLALAYLYYFNQQKQNRKNL